MKEYKKIEHKDVKEAVNKMVDFIKPTYGPANYSVIISDQYRNDNLDDGVTIADNFELKDKFENAIIKSVKEALNKTKTRVGDGTTGTSIILQALINSDIQISNLKKAASEAKEQLTAVAKKISTKEELKNVAKVSYNDEEMAITVSDIVHTVGKDGVIAVEESNSLQTTTEIVNGLRFDKGYISPYMITDMDRMEAVLEDPLILITNKKISSVKEIMPILEKIINSGKKDILIIAEDIEGEALALFIINKMKGMFNVVGVKTPGYGEETNNILEDVAALTGGTLISKDANMNITDITLEELGSSRKVVVTKDSTTIISGNGKDIDKRVSMLKNQSETIQEEYQKKKIEERIAKLVGGIALIKVGATTEVEMKKIKKKVENAVNSTKLAFKSGVVSGAGKALLSINTSDENLNNALRAPYQVLTENLGEFQTDETITDPAEVLIAAIESAVSIANMLILTKGVIVDVPEENPQR